MSSRKSTFIKSPNIPIQINSQQAKEYIRCIEDPVYFISNYCIILNTAKGKLSKFELFDYQKRILENYQNFDKNIVMIGRQLGKTTLAAAYCLWWSVFKSGQLVLISSNIGRNATEIMIKIKNMYIELPDWIKPGMTKDNVFEYGFDNNTRILAQTTTINTGRGLTPALVYLDEFAFVPMNIQKGFWTSISPTLSEGGKLIITSTPDTDEDVFSRIWFSATDAPNSHEWRNGNAERQNLNINKLNQDDYETVYEIDDLNEKDIKDTNQDVKQEEKYGFRRFFVHWSEHPNRGPEFKARMLGSGEVTLSEWNRDFECIFAGAEDSLIGAATLAKLRNYIRPPRFVDRYGVKWFEFIEPNNIYCVTIDPSEGIGKDNAVIQVWSLPDFVQVAEWANNETSQHDQARIFVKVLQRIEYELNNDEDQEDMPSIYYSIECNGIGRGVLNLITAQEDMIPGMMIDSEGNSTRGLRTTEPTKRHHSLQLKDLIERGVFVPYSNGLLSELKSFIKVGKSYKAKPGLNDDRVMSCVLMSHLIEELRYTEPDIEDALNPSVLDDEYNDTSEDHFIDIVT